MRNRKSAAQKLCVKDLKEMMANWDDDMEVEVEVVVNDKPKFVASGPVYEVSIESGVLVLRST